jgi:tRNA (guanine37-N1)-methyltransferase
MRIDIISIFPEIFTPLESSIIDKAQKNNLVSIKIWDLRDFVSSKDRHRKVDDAPYGGGKGMVFKCEPIFKAVRKIKKENKRAKVILTTPQGELFTQKKAKDLSSEDGLIIICGHYEGIDERVTSLCDEEISIGDYILTGGELPAMVITESVVRLLKGVLPTESFSYDSFYTGLLDWPCYTRPEVYNKIRVPEILLSGNHKKISEWRLEQSLKRTKERRPDLYKEYLAQLKKKKI